MITIFLIYECANLSLNVQYMADFVQDCSKSSALRIELL